MKGLTLWPPRAWLVPDPKGIETRGWDTKYRGWLAVHVSKEYPREGRAFGRHPAVAEALPRVLEETGWEELPRGAIVAVVRLVGVIPTDLFRPPTRETLWGDYSPGRYAWIFDNGRRLRQPIDCRGRQGLWDVDIEIVAQIRAEWKNGRKGD